MLIMSVYKNDRLSWVKEAILSSIEGTVLPGEILVIVMVKVDVSVYNLLLKFKKELPKIFYLRIRYPIRAELFQGNSCWR